MTVLTIRAHKRYAARHPVRLGTPGAAAADGLLIELSSEGCRISQLTNGAFAPGERIAVHLGQVVLPGRIRWAHDGLAGVRFDNALRAAQLSELVALARSDGFRPQVGSNGRERAGPAPRRYGT